MKADLRHRTQAYLTDQLFDFTAHCSVDPTYHSFYFAPIKKSRKSHCPALTDTVYHCLILTQYYILLFCQAI